MTADRTQIDEPIWQRGVQSLAGDERALLERVRAAISIGADVSRSDLFLLLPGASECICVAVHAQPHSMASLYTESPVGHCYDSSERRWLWTATMQGLRRSRIVPEAPEQSTEVAQQTLPILGRNRRPLGALVVYTNAIERERHRRREPAFRRSLEHFLQMLAEGEVQGTETLPPFHDQDGILFVNHLAQYQYLSGQANNVYRRLGYLDDLRGRTVNEVAAGDLKLIRMAWETRACIFNESTVRSRILLRSAIPLLGKPALSWGERLRRKRPPNHYGAFILVKDVTEERAKAQELNVKAVMLKEVHHRVKNNLQQLVSITRMQARRAETEEARHLLHEMVNRILSIAVIHEELEEGEDQVLNFQAIAQKIVSQVQQGAVSPDRNIKVRLVAADGIWLPTNKATTCALVINELLLNAVEHGYADDAEGKVQVFLHDLGDQIEIRVEDDGRGLPEDFSLERKSNLGLDIVNALVHDSLKGTLKFNSQPGSGTRAVVIFPKTFPESPNEPTV